MKKTILALAIVSGLMLPVAAHAGCGAIAIGSYDPSRWSVSYGWINIGSAENYALEECQANGEPCYIFQWECNQCAYGPEGIYTCN